MNFTLNLTFLSERMRIKKVEKLVANLHDKSEYVIHIRNLKQDHFKQFYTLKSWISFEKKFIK